MAQKVQVLLVCDLDDGNVDAEESLRFSLGNAAYEVDVCAKHAQQIRAGLDPFIEHARKVGATSRPRPRSGTNGQQTAAIRSWAKGRGIHINDRGRIPASVVKQYEAAH